MMREMPGSEQQHLARQSGRGSGKAGRDHQVAAAPERWLAAEAMDSLTLGVVVATAEASVLYANQAAKALCSQHPSVKLDRRLLASGARENARLRDVLLCVAASQPCGGLMLGRAPGPRLALLAAALPSGLGNPGSRSNVVLVTLRPLALPPLALPPQIDAALLRSLFGLSPSEADVACALASGLGVAATAAQRGTSPLTVRAQVRQILRKADMASLRDLVSAIGHLG